MNIIIIDFNSLNEEYLQKYRSIYLKSFNKFNKLLEEILIQNSKIKLLISHPIFSRNNYLSTFYEDYCSLMLLSEIITNKNKYKVLARNFNQKILFTDFFINYKNISFVSPNKNIIKIYSKQLLILIKNLIFLISLYPLKFLIKPLKVKKINIVVINIIDSMFSNNQFKDRYYNGIEPELKNNKNTYFYPIFLIKNNYLKKIKIMNSSLYKIIFPFHYITFTELFKIYFYFINFFKIKINNQNKYLNKYLKNKFFENLISTETFFSFLNYYFIKGLKKNNMILSKSINWYENQPMEKGYNLSINNYFPNCINKGYKSYFVDNNFHFYIRPTEYEMKSRVIPKIIASNFYYDVTDLKLFTKSLNIVPAPLFRFSYFNLLKHKNKISNNSILVCLPIYFEESLSILKLVNNFLAFNTMYNFLIKPHPFLKISKLKKYIRHPNIKLTYDNNDLLFSRCFVLITNTSSISLESLLQGLPVIISSYMQKNIQNPLNIFNSNNFIEVYNVKQLILAIDQINDNNYKLDSYKIMKKITGFTYGSKLI